MFIPNPLLEFHAILIEGTYDQQKIMILNFIQIFRLVLQDCYFLRKESHRVIEQSAVFKKDYSSFTEWVGVGVAKLNLIQRYSLRISARIQAILSELFHSFPQSLRTKIRKIFVVGHGFFQNYFQFVCHPIILLCMTQILTKS